MVFNSNSMAMALPSDHLSILQILRQAGQLPTKSGALFYPLLLLTLLSSFLKFFFYYYMWPPLLRLVSAISTFLEDPTGPPAASAPPPTLLLDMEKDIRDVTSLLYVFTVTSFFISLFLMVATIYTFSMAYRSNKLTPKELMLRIDERWYQTLVTRMYKVLLSLGLGLLSSAQVATVVIMSTGSKVVCAIGVGLGLPLLLLYFYLLTRWNMSLVIAVVEETWGVGALSWSVELFIGNRKRGTVLTFVLMSVYTAIHAAFGVMMTMQIKMALVAAAANALWEMYAMAVYVVFYYECRKSHGFEEKIADEGGFFYCSLPATTKPKADAVY